jgi:hypothetical protein
MFISGLKVFNLGVTLTFGLNNLRTMGVKSLIIALLGLCMGNVLRAQSKPFNFHPPMKVPLLVTAGYGEIRPDHFHSGLDFSTYQKKQAIYSIDEGYVSRVKVSAYGYGNALYVSHPNGFISVYAHLDSFNDTLNAYVRAIQERAREYEVDVFADSLEFPVKKGQLIGFSGNSGSSSAPHLHFEIRDQQYDNTLNPLLFGFSEPDKTPPDLKSVAIIPFKQFGRVNNLSKTLSLPLVLNKKTKKKSLSTKTPLPVVSGWVGFGFQGGDVIGKTSNLTGIYDIRVEVDSLEIFHARFDAFSFSETRAVNAYIDYEEKLRLNRKIQRCVVPSNAMIGIYKSQENNGYYFFGENRIYQVKYVVTDFAGNSRSFEIKVRGKTPDFDTRSPLPKEGYIEAFPGEASVWNLNELAEVQLGARALFDTLQLKFRKGSKPDKWGLSVELGSMYEPLNEAIVVRIKPSTTQEELLKKLVMVQQHGSQSQGLKTRYQNGWMEASSKRFGDFWLALDTVPPQISRIAPKPAVNAKKKKSSKKGKAKAPVAKPIQNIPAASGWQRIKISDALSGLESVQAYLNDDWFLLQPSEASGVWEFRFPEELPFGCYVLRIEATDAVGNRIVWEKEFEKNPPLPTSP